MDQSRKFGLTLLGLLMAVQLLPALSTTADAASSESAALLLSKNFDNMTSISDDPDLKPDQGKIINGVTYRFQDPLGGNNKALRIYMTGDNDSGYTEKNTGEWKHRAQMGISNFSILPNVDYWFGYRIWGGTTWPTNQAGTIGIFDPVSGSLPAECGIDTYDGKFVIKRQWRDGNGNLQQDKLPNITFPKGKWTNIIVHYRRGFNNDGAFQVWIDGVKRTPSSWLNANTSFDKEAVGIASPRLRIGHYFVGDRPGTVWDLYVDDLKVAQGANGYAAVDPAGAGAGTFAAPATPTGLQIAIDPSN